jgi:hypothetical protein
MKRGRGEDILWWQTAVLEAVTTTKHISPHKSPHFLKTHSIGYYSGNIAYIEYVGDRFVVMW